MEWIMKGWISARKRQGKEDEGEGENVVYSGESKHLGKKSI